MSCGRIVAVLLATTASASLGACVATAPTSTAIKINNVSYPSREAALEAQRRQVDTELQQVELTSQRLGGAALIILPSLGDTRANLDRNGAITNAEAKETLARVMDIGVVANGQAIDKAKVFDSVRIVRNDDPASQVTSDIDYKLTVTRSPTGSFKWTLAKRNGGERDLVFANGQFADVPRWNALNISLLNAAADLGLPVTRQPLPVGNAGSPTPGGISTGTGFFINTDGFAMSNAHVVEGCKSVKMSLGDGTTADANVVAVDHQNDLALIKVPSRAGAYAQFSGGPPLRQGEDVVVFGYPLAGALASQGNLSTGVVSALAGMGDDTRQLQITAQVQPGNSGGPLLDSSGNVIGVVTAKLNAVKVATVTGDIPQNVNFAIKANIATNFLDSNGTKYDRAPVRKGLNTADVSDRAKTFTVKVTCQR